MLEVTAHETTDIPSLKPSKQDEQDMRNTAGKARTNSLVTFSYWPLQMVMLVQADTHEVLCVDAGCSLEDMLEVVGDRDE